MTAAKNGANFSKLPGGRQHQNFSLALLSTTTRTMKRKVFTTLHRMINQRCGGSSGTGTDRKSTRLNSSHSSISYAVFCLQKNIFFFNDTATTEIYTLSLHDALPILKRKVFTTLHRMINQRCGGSSGTG